MDEVMEEAAAAAPEAMPDDELASALERMEEQAVGYLNSEIGDEQELAMDYYYARPFGDERDGRSSVIEPVVSIVVDNALAALLKPFTSSDETVSFAPHGPEDEKVAHQATEYVNYVWNFDNPGFMVMHDWFKDALLQKLGVIKIWWEDKSQKRQETVRFTADEIEGLALVEGPYETEVPGLFEGTVERDYADGCVRIEGVPPEEFRVSQYARSLDEAEYVAHICVKPRSELIAMGFDPGVVETLKADTSSLLDDGRERARRRDEDGLGRIAAVGVGTSRDSIKVAHEFVRIDADGDGVSELLEVIRAGRTILYRGIADEQPFASLCPVPMPHKVYGQSLADKVIDVQRRDSVMMRQTLDNFYLSNNPRPVVVEDLASETTMDDLLDTAPGSPIVVRRPDALGSFAVPFVADKAFPMLERSERSVMARTGVSLVGQGMDPNALKREQTATQSMIEEGGRNARIEMIARIFAETGVKSAFRRILRLVVRYQPRERVIRLRNEWVTIDPRGWNADMDVRISVGLGVGNRQEQAQGAMMSLEVMERLGQSPYAFLLKPNGVYTVVKRVLSTAGFKNTDDILVEPTEERMAEMAAQPQEPDPETVKAQAELQMKQADMQAKQQEAALKLQLSEREAAAKMDLERERATFEAGLAQAKADREYDLAQQRMAMEMRLAEQRMAFEMEMAREKAAADRDAKVEAAKIGADSKISNNRPGGSLSE